jgi:RND family efflux transporter MFP subunit
MSTWFRSPAREGGAPGAAIAAWAGCLLAIGGCARHDGPAAPAGAPVPVALHTVAEETEASFVEAVGTLRAAREATIASKVMGTVTEIRKRAGDPVREGEIVVVVDSRDVAGQIAQAQGALAQAKAAAALAAANARRFEDLHRRGSASDLELDQARYQDETAKGAVIQAEGAVATASSYEDYARIPAPFAGRVVDRLCEVGDLASPGRPLLQVEDASRVRLFASLEASRAGAAVAGTAVQVRVPELGERSFPGTIGEVTPSADPVTRTVLVKVDLDADPALQAGVFGRVLIPSGERKAVRVPAASIVRRGGVAGVFVSEDGRASFRMVTIAEDGADRPEILAGLVAGESVIVGPPATLVIGAAIEARP